MNKLTLPTHINIAIELYVATFMRRLFAWMIDFCIFFIYLYLIIDFIDSNEHIVGSADAWWFFLILLLPIALYHVVLESLLNGQTIGKKFLKIRVINEKGGNATISQFIIRWMLRISDIIMLIMILLVIAYGSNVILQFMFVSLLSFADVLCILLTHKSQRLGDIAAGTIVVSTQNKESLHKTVFMDIDDNYIPQYPAIMKLSDRDMNMIKNIYDSLLKKYNQQLAERSKTKIAKAIGVEAKEDALSFIEIVLKDYNFLSTR